MESSERHNTLVHFRFNPEYKAERGRHGEGSNKTGREGEARPTSSPSGWRGVMGALGDLIGFVLDLIFIALICLAPVTARADDPAPTPIETRAAVHAGFARLVFAPPSGGKSVPFTATSDGTTLTPQFQAVDTRAELDQALAAVVRAR